MKPFCVVCVNILRKNIQYTKKKYIKKLKHYKNLILKLKEK